MLRIVTVSAVLAVLLLAAPKALSNEPDEPVHAAGGKTLAQLPLSQAFRIQFQNVTTLAFRLPPNHGLAITGMNAPLDDQVGLFVGVNVNGVPIEQVEVGTYFSNAIHNDRDGPALAGSPLIVWPGSTLQLATLVRTANGPVSGQLASLNLRGYILSAADLGL